MRRWVLDLAASALLLAVPIIGFAPTFDGPSFLLAAIGGAVLGLAIAAVGARLRWGVLVIAAVTVATYFVFGGMLALPSTALAGAVPTLDTLRGLGVGAVESFKQLITTPAPVSASDGFLIVPYVLSLVAAVLVGSLGLRTRTPAWALIPATAYLAIQIALGTSQPSAPLVQGIVFGGVAIAWLAIRRAWAPAAAAVALDAAPTPSARGASGRRIAAGAGILALAIGCGAVAGAVAAPPTTRYVLRDVVIAPFDVHQYASPLQSYRGYVRDYTKTPLFTVSGLPKGARVRVAAMDAYSGTVYDVSDSGAGMSSAFSPARTNMSPDATGAEATVRISIDGYSGVWVPGVGSAQSITFDGPRADALRRTAFYNESTQTAVDTTPLQKGDSYVVQAVVPAEHSDASLAKTPFAPIKLPAQHGVPRAFADLASKAVGDASTPIAQVRALQKHFAEGGYYSDGLEGQPRSLAGHGAGRISALVGAQQMVGDDEQYAVAMALFAQQLGIPARVVLGFYPKERAASGVFTANSDTLHAWVEVAFQGVGWVPFDPTPAKDRVPTEETTTPKTQPKPQVLQPPPPAQEPADQPPSIPDDRGKDDRNSTLPGWIGAALAIGGGTLGVVALLLAPFVAMGIVKGVRRRRRREAPRPSDRISGGWDELVDRALDLGTPLSPGATRAEDASAVATAFEQPAVATLAREADAQVFGPAEPTPDDVERFWIEVDAIVGGMTANRSFWRRLGARLSIRSLRSGRGPAASIDSRPSSSPPDPPARTAPKDRP
jgi:transglutaminase-like putative cysteine protease